jgi:FAD/FMN-containing dehydrogenase
MIGTSSPRATSPIGQRRRASLTRQGRRSAHTFYFNTINALLFVSSLTRRTLHEGRYARLTGKWTNWNREYSCRPRSYEQPETEEEICRVVREAKGLRVTGGGHSFNSSPLTEDTLLSLDNYRAVLNVDTERKVVTVQAGLRLRELGERLLGYGLALPCLGSTNGQSIAGLVSTDLHGTGRDHGFLSEQILSLRVVDSSGRAETYPRDSAVFRAAVGGIGCAGVVTEVELQCVDSFRLRKSVTLISREEAENETDRIIAENDHVSLYYLGSINCGVVRMNCWNRTTDANSNGQVRKKLSTELADLSFSGYIFGLAHTLHCLPAAYGVATRLMPLAYPAKGFVADWHCSFPRKLFFSHDEIEYGIPYENFRPCIRDLMDLMEKHRFVSFIEVRFTPDRSRALLGPGVGRRTCYIELAPSRSVDCSEFFSLTEKMLLKYGGQPHLGKKTYLNAEGMRRVYGERFDEFRKICSRQDPEEKFLNRFTRELFGGVRQSVG